MSNDEKAFSRLFHEDPIMQRQLARQRFSIPGFNNITPLHVASKNGNQWMVKDLVEGVADVTNRLEGGFTSLVSASKAGHVGVVNYLASLPTQQDYGSSLSDAIQAGHMPVVKTLIHRVVYNPRDLDTAIGLAHQVGRSYIAEYLGDRKIEYLQQEKAARERQRMVEAKRQ